MKGIKPVTVIRVIYLPNFSFHFFVKIHMNHNGFYYSIKNKIHLVLSILNNLLNEALPNKLFVFSNFLFFSKRVKRREKKYIDNKLC